MKVAILTISDMCSSGQREDKSGKVIENMIKKLPAEVVRHDIAPDKLKTIKEKIIYYTDTLKVDLILTTGGTGFSPTDVTPEATGEVIEKEVPGLPEAMRMGTFSKTKMAILSRARAGIRGQTLIINLPGSANGVEETLGIIIGTIPHAVEILKGGGH